MNLRPTSINSSPLINPSVCSVILITPSEQDLSSISRSCCATIRRNFSVIIRAAHTIKVPALLFSPGIEPGRHGFVKSLPEPRVYREFMAQECAFPWQNPAFTAALDREDKAILVIAGFWLEHEVLATALHALADSYDVYVLVDATPAREQGAAQLSHDRLIQAGATPVVTSQVIREWAAEASVAVRRALSALL